MKLRLPWRRRSTEALVDPDSRAPAGAEPRGPVLQPLTEETQWGRSEIIGGELAIRIVEQVWLVPDRPGGHWGVFHPDGTLVEETLDRVGPDGTPMRPEPVFPLDPTADAPWLPAGDYLYGGFVYGHFGHFIIDSLPRLWPVARELRPGQKILMEGAGGPDSWWSYPWMADIFRSLGLRKTDFVDCREPVRIERLAVPQRTLQGQAWGHPAYAQMTRRIGAALLGDLEPPGGRPIYLSKTRLTGGVQRVVNEKQLESYLRPRGVEIVYPETLSLRDQLALFASGRTVSGITTSAMHLSAFAPPARLRALNPSPHVNGNFLLLDKLNAVDAAYFQPVGAREVARNSNGFMVEHAFVDPVAAGRELLAML